MANQGTSWELILNKEFEICVKLQLKLNDDDDEEEWINLSWKIMQFNWFLFPNLNVPSLIFRTVWLASPSSSQGCIMYLEKNRRSANELSVLGCVPEASHWDTWSWLLGSNSEKLLYGEGSVFFPALLKSTDGSPKNEINKVLKMPALPIQENNYFSRPVKVIKNKNKTKKPLGIESFKELHFFQKTVLKLLEEFREGLCLKCS